MVVQNATNGWQANNTIIYFILKYNNLSFLHLQVILWSLIVANTVNMKFWIKQTLTCSHCGAPLQTIPTVEPPYKLYQLPPYKLYPLQTIPTVSLNNNTLITKFGFKRMHLISPWLSSREQHTLYRNVNSYM